MPLIPAFIPSRRNFTAKRHWVGRGGAAVQPAWSMDEVQRCAADKANRTEAHIGGILLVHRRRARHWLLGLVFALPLLVFLYTLIEGKEKWYIALIATACTYALVWGLFEYMLETRWPPGILFD